MSPFSARIKENKDLRVFVTRSAPRCSRDAILFADVRLVELVRLLGTKSWTLVAARLGGGRNGKQCRERWHNHLDPDVKKGPWTESEDAIIIANQRKFGNMWARIAEVVSRAISPARARAPAARSRERTPRAPPARTAERVRLRRCRARLASSAWRARRCPCRAHRARTATAPG